MNPAQMDTIPLSSDSESGGEPANPPPKAAPVSEEEEPATPQAPSPADAKTTLGPTPDLIPRSEADPSSPAREASGPEEEEADEEKQRLIAQVLELQHTLEDLSARVDSVKEENLKLRSENQILGQYIENLMAASSVFQSSTPRMRRKASSGQTGAKAGLKLPQD